MLLEIEREIYLDKPRTASLFTRLQEVITTASNPVQEPVMVVKRRGRPAGAINKNSLTRDKSLSMPLEENAGLVAMPGTIENLRY